MTRDRKPKDIGHDRERTDPPRPPAEQRRYVENWWFADERLSVRGTRLAAVSWIEHERLASGMRGPSRHSAPD